MRVDQVYLNSLIPDRDVTSLKDLPNELRLFKRKNIECWYAPLGKVNCKARIAFYGITPGWVQMKIAYKVFNHNRLKAGNRRRSYGEIAFSGSSRSNLADMLQAIGLTDVLKLNSIDDMFESALASHSSVLRYPVFYKRKNYNGHTPSILKCEEFLEIFESILLAELKEYSNVLVVPLGLAVSKAFEFLMSMNDLDGVTLLREFPHPSPRNVSRKEKFAKHKSYLMDQIEEWKQSQ